MVTEIVKCWEGDFNEVLARWRDIPKTRERWLITNNMQTRLPKYRTSGVFDHVIRAEDYFDIAQESFGLKRLSAAAEPYTKSEIVGIWLADTDYIVQYASDVEPPTEDWVTPSLELLKDYAVVSPFWDTDAEYFIKDGSCERTDFGLKTQFFSDQAYLIDTRVFKKRIYNHKHPIGEAYPRHGHDNFEKRVAMWLADTNRWRAVVTRFTYKHIDSRNK